MGKGQKPGKLVTHWQDVMPCYLSIQDRNLIILEINKLFRQDFGNRIGERCYEVYKNRREPCSGCPVLMTFEDGENHTGQQTVVTQYGEQAHVVITSTPLYTAQGEIEAVVEMSTNVTEIKTLRKELDRERSSFKTLFDLVPCYISIQDRNFVIQQTNKLFREDFGDSEGRRCYCAYKKRDAVCHDCPVEKTFNDGEIHSSEETVKLQDGRTAQVLVHSMPIRDEAGDISSVMELSTNITEVKKLQRRLAMMGLAVAGMAHRIKNILMGLEGGIFVVNTGFELEEEETVNEGWEMVERNVERISCTVKDLLYCSKPHELPLEDVDLSEILQEVYDLYKPRADKDGIALRLEVAGDMPRGAFNNQGMHKLVTNLTSNALDACLFDPEGDDKQHAITLRCSHRDGVAHIEVEDNGGGIPDDVHHKVFENFFSTKGTDGTGLGLLVSQKVVEEHGGTISFSTTLGHGTTFLVKIPDRPADREAEQA